MRKTFSDWVSHGCFDVDVDDDDEDYGANIFGQGVTGVLIPFIIS